jgi:hypothetical protein
MLQSALPTSPSKAMASQPPIWPQHRPAWRAKRRMSRHWMLKKARDPPLPGPGRPNGAFRAQERQEEQTRRTAARPSGLRRRTLAATGGGCTWGKPSLHSSRLGWIGIELLPILFHL